MNGPCTIDGSVMSVIFQNEENGYTVLRLTTGDGEVVTVVGTIPCAAPGESMIVEGRWMTHPTPGEQVRSLGALRREQGIFGPVLLVDCGLTEEGRKLCALLAKKDRFVSVCTREEVPGYLI